MAKKETKITGKTFHVYSKLANNNSFIEWLRGGADVNTKGRVVHIAGGANVITKSLITPLGVHTEISEDDANFLRQDEHFKKHVSEGFMSLQERSVDIESIVVDMGDKVDKSAPLTTADQEDFNKLPTKVMV
ncbi:hypothetical protein UFOVP138_63 [uncultured Caudovirales phage]|uniref:Uncharacterized protein n=1 Tax=uncultured Caudovirales phage TaxID=2100421 RepID=A0A6J5LC34_9CAUD|nr:hypothetical protein UFOVP138_63 [uncultured Caudovirales phage]